MRPELHKKIKFKKDFYCPAPFVYLYLNAGKNTIKMCCEARYSGAPVDDKSVPFENLLKQYFYNDDTLIDVRKKLLKGEEPLQCFVCGDRERKGWRSDRHEFLEEFENDITVDLKYGNQHKQPLALDIRPGNVCNLKCRMCDAGNSSMIALELKKYPELKQYYNHPSKDETEISFNMIDFFKDIDFSLVRRLNILGGEPTIDPNTINFLKNLIDLGHTDIGINMTSNCTNFKKHSDVFKKFKCLNVCLSLDGIEKHYEYIRTGSKWETVLENFEILKTFPNLVGMSHNLVLQMYNIFNVKEWLIYYYNLRQHEKSRGLNLGAPYIQACEEPPHFHPSILFDEDKNFVISEINDFFKNYNHNVEKEFVEKSIIPIQTCLKDPIHEKFDTYQYPTIIPNSIDELRKHFKIHTNIQDKIRNTKAIDYLHPRIKKYL